MQWNVKYDCCFLCNLFLLGSLTLFIKCCLFNYFAFNSIFISSFYFDPLSFWAFYLPKISISLFIALVIFIFRKKSLFIVLLLLSDAWCIANLCYYRSCGFLIDVYALSMVNNMDGFWTSSFYLLEIKDLYFLFANVPYVLMSILYDLNKDFYFTKNIRILVFCMILFAISHIISMFCLADITLRDKSLLFNKYYDLFHDRENPKLLDYFYVNPFSRTNREVLFWDASDFSYQVKKLSILHSPGIIFSDYYYMNNDKYTINQDDIDIIDNYINVGDMTPSFDSKLILILLESFENWVLTPDIMPNLYNFISNNPHILYSTKISSQIAQGSSSDGQLIINTGLLPIKSGATVFRYPLNRFPNFASLAKGKSAVVLPHDTKVWNQTMMSPAYGYDTTFVCDIEDEKVFEKTIECIYGDFQVVQVLTISSHAPFDDGAKKSKYKTDVDLPFYMYKYIKCFNYTDECLSLILNKITSDSVFNSATVLITGDHTILTPDKREEFKDCCKKNNLSYRVEEDYCPLIIYSPSISSKKIINEKCYQMDIFPTLLSILNCKNYYWKGFGRNLNDDILQDVDINELRTLSDKIIRSDYFSSTH